MNLAEAKIEAALGYAVDWSATGSWVGALGTILAIGFAISVPNGLERKRQEREVRGLLERRQAAYRAMFKVIDILGNKGFVELGEVEGVVGVLSEFDLAIFTEDGIEALVALRNRVTVAAARHRRLLTDVPGGVANLDFNADAARANLRICAKSMGVSEGP